MLAQNHSTNGHERIGRYEVLRKIATGGMAELFLAKMVGMEGFEKVVAIKRILAHLAYDEEFINMFRDEARIVAKLSHPNIVQIYDLGKSDDTYFIAMEYIPGRNLSSIAKKARARSESLPPTYIARCLAQACEGLYYAHTRKDIDGRPLKIVHRDVSPQNIIVSFSGTVKLVDFGIAKAATKIAHTRAGVLKGKYAYMSPEQIRGEETDARSDLFAVGIVLYELLCGRRPFEKENSIQTLKAIVQDPHVDCRALNDEIPDELAEIIDRALTKDPNARYQDAQELQVDLEDFVQTSSKRVNNITISRWVTDLFEEELSRERGGTVVFQGVGEVILPETGGAAAADDDDDDDIPDAEISASFDAEDVSEPLVPLSRGRGGGSVGMRPPIPAPSNSMVSELDQTGGSRREMIEEGIIDRPSDGVDGEYEEGGWDEDATVHGMDSVSMPVQSAKKPAYSDDRTEFAPPHVPPEEDTSDFDGDEIAIAASENATLSPDEIQMSHRPAMRTPSDVMALDVGESLLGPLEDDGGEDAFLTDDPWDEATIGYPDGQLPIHTEDDEEDAEDVGQPSSPTPSFAIPPASTKSVDGPPELDSLSDVFDGDEDDGWGELSDNFVEGDATIAGDPAVWDDETASRDAYVAPDDVPSSAVPEVVGEDSDNIDLEDLLAPADVADDGHTHRGDSTIALPSVSEDMLRRAQEDGTDDFPAEFEGEATVAATEAYEREAGSEMEESELPETSMRADSGGWSSDATVAGGPPLEELLRAQAEERANSMSDEMPDIGAEGDHGGVTIRAMDEEPELPVPRVDRGEELDARTVAGVTSDYLAAGVEIPMGGDYEGADDPVAVFDEPPTMPPTGPKKRGQEVEALGAIRLERVELRHNEEVTHKGDELITGPSIDPPEPDLMPPPSRAAEPSLPELDEVEFEFVDDDPDDAPPVEPSPLDDDDPNFSPIPSVAGEEYSALVQPEVPKPLMPPSSPGKIGSTNVPPSNLSLSQVLSNPMDAQHSSPDTAPPRSASMSSRSASILGRQIREVVRSDGSDAPAPAPASPSAIQFAPQSLAPHPAELPESMMPPLGAPEQMMVPAAAPAGPSPKRRALVIGLVALAVLLLSGVAFVSIPLLFPAQPRLELNSTPPGASVFVDGVKQPGATPMTIRGLEPGTAYMLRVELDGYQPMSRKLSLPESRPLIWNIPLKKN